MTFKTRKACTNHRLHPAKTPGPSPRIKNDCARWLAILQDEPNRGAVRYILSMPEPRPILTLREFRIAPKYRRIGVYLLVSGPMIGGMVLVIVLLGLAPPPVQGALPLVVAAGPLIALLFIPGAVCTIAGIRYRFRIDGDGIARRRFWHWETWPWEAFRSGEVARGSSNSRYRWCRPNAPPRTLSLEFLPDEDRRFVRTVINAVWVRLESQASDSPAKISVRFGWRKRARLTKKGVLLVSGQRSRSWTWSQVRELRVFRFERDAIEPTALQMDLLDQTLNLNNMCIENRQRGISMYRLERFIKERIAAGSIVEIACKDPPTSLREIEIREASTCVEGVFATQVAH